MEQLAEDLQEEFAGMEGLSSRNIWRMRMFYSTYEKLPPMVAEIGWSHNILIIEKCKGELERQFYIGMTKKYGWTKNVGSQTAAYTYDAGGSKLRSVQG